MKKNPGRKERRSMQKTALIKGYGHHSPVAGSIKKNKLRKQNSN